MGYDIWTAAIFSGALGVTAEATVVKVLLDTDVVNTKLGTIFLTAGVIDDVVEVLILTMILVPLKGATLEVARLPIQLILFAFISYLMLLGTSKFLKHFRKDIQDLELFSLGILLAISLASISQFLGFGYLLGAIISGFVFQTSLKGTTKREEIAKVSRLVTMALVAPFFFVSIGLRFDISLLLSNPALIIISTVLAIDGSILGSLLVKPFSRLRFKELYIVGLGMSSKGSAELVIALLAVKYGLIPSGIFSAIVAMAMITTLAVPFMLEREIKKNPLLWT